MCCQCFLERLIAVLSSDTGSDFAVVCAVQRTTFILAIADLVQFTFNDFGAHANCTISHLLIDTDQFIQAGDLSQNLSDTGISVRLCDLATDIVQCIYQCDLALECFYRFTRFVSDNLLGIFELVEAYILNSSD